MLSPLDTTSRHEQAVVVHTRSVLDTVFSLFYSKFKILYTSLVCQTINLVAISYFWVLVL